MQRLVKPQGLITYFQTGFPLPGREPEADKMALTSLRQSWSSITNAYQKPNETGTLT
ncbi:MAG: hypothetical protein IPJ98_00295 [Bryobacterales bacterium]|nr:hypothetical protein [Bryobacterales bacterium]